MSKQAKAAWYATDNGGEWSSSFEGPCVRPEEALQEYSEQYEPEDDTVISVMRGEPAGVPSVGSSAVEWIEENMYECVGAPSWPEDRADGKALAKAIDEAVTAFLDAHPHMKPTGWQQVGRAEELTVREAQERIAQSARPAAPKGGPG